MTSKKKIFIATILLAAVLGTAGFFFFIQKESSFTPNAGEIPQNNIFPFAGRNEQNQNEENTPTPEEEERGPSDYPRGTLFRVSRSQTSSVTIHENQIVYHKNTAEFLGHLFTNTPDGEKEVRMSNFTIPQIGRVIWDASGQNAVVSYTVNGELQHILVHYKGTSTPETRFLPPTLTSAAFSPDSSLLAYTVSEEGNTRLYTTGLRATPSLVLSALPPITHLAWPQRDIIALQTPSSYAYRSFLYTFNRRTGALQKVTDGYGLSSLWNKDGTIIFITETTPSGTLLPARAITFPEKKEQKLPVVTIASKCAFSLTVRDLLYCGVPQTLATAAQYPDTWWQGKEAFLDALMVIDISEEKIETITASPFDISHAAVNSQETFLALRDRSSGEVWSLQLTDHILASSSPFQ